MSSETVVLYSAAPSYYSMIARLGLAEHAVPYRVERVDIHKRNEQLTPSYAALNPELTVPTLVASQRVVPGSGAILDYLEATAPLGFGPAPAIESQWRTIHDGLPMDLVTFGRFVESIPFADRLVQRQLRKSGDALEALAAQNPELAPIYQRKATVVRERAVALADPEVRAQARGKVGDALRWLDDTLARSSGDFLGGKGYGNGDIIATVFLARMTWTKNVPPESDVPHVARYWRSLRSRPSFLAADVWDKPRFLRLARIAIGLG